MQERNSDGKFLPGNPGRPEGTPNKVTKAQREFIQSLLEDQQDKIKKELEKLTGKDYLNAVTGLLEFALPKLTGSELSTEGSKSVQVITGMVIN